MSVFYISIIIFSGILFARLLSIVKFPEVTGFLIAGIIIGPSVLGLIPSDSLEGFEIISSVALSFIAFSIGSEMKFSKLRKFGKKIIVITIFEALGALVVVFIGSYFIFNQDLPFSLSLASIACATAPAATLMVINQYKAKGDIVDVLLPVVALDDAICIIAFGICSSLSSSILKGSSGSIFAMFLTPLFEIVASILVGLFGGLIYTFISKKMKNDMELMSFTIATIFILQAVSEKFGLSSLLTLMSTSVFIANFSHNPRRSFEVAERITPPLFMAFFVISGADLNLKSVLTVGGIGVFYIVARAFGKYMGAYISSKITGLSKNIQKYLGLTLIPQAGVAIGLSLIASRELPSSHGQAIRTIILGATIVYELVGPLLAKFALTKAGAIKLEK